MEQLHENQAEIYLSNPLVNFLNITPRSPGLSVTNDELLISRTIRNPTAATIQNVVVIFFII